MPGNSASKYLLAWVICMSWLATELHRGEFVEVSATILY